VFQAATQRFTCGTSGPGGKMSAGRPIDERVHRCLERFGGETMEDTVKDKIRQQINSDRIVIYMKGTRDFPQCGFSAQVAQIFKMIGVPFTTVNVLADYEVREGIKTFSNWPTIPQIYLNGEFVGGCDIVTDLYQRGELQGMVQKALEDERRQV
jgi:monothiol glutaredoxin